MQTTNHLYKTFFLLFIALAVMVTVLIGSPTSAQQTSDREQVQGTDWTEPKGLSVADLVGILPESVLDDAIITWMPSRGIMQYESGSRVGQTVSLSVKFDVTDSNDLFCLAKEGFQDEFATATAPMSMRLFDGSVDVTSRVNRSFSYIPAGIGARPVNPPVDNLRYDRENATFGENADGSLQIPANLGCFFTVNGATLSNPRATFTFESKQYISVELIHQATQTSRSYVGGGAGARHTALRNQMTDMFGFRHDGWKPEIYGDDALRTRLFDADYIFVKFPPQPDGPFIDTPGTPASGTYRVMFSNGAWFYQSVDHSISMLLPFHTQWRDVDLIGNGEQFLPTQNVFERLNSNFTVNDEIKSSEYFLPPGVPYNPCVTNGGCSQAYLQQVYDTSHEVEIYFYKVERVGSGLTEVPLRMVGNGFSRSVTAPAGPLVTIETPAATSALLPPAGANMLFLPAILRAEVPELHNPNLDCPCGWFDVNGRMFDFEP